MPQPLPPPLPGAASPPSMPSGGPDIALPTGGGTHPSFRDVLRRAVGEVAAAERGMSRSLRLARAGETLSTHQLIAVQAGVYRHAHRLELTSKLVDQASNGVKRTLESQR